MFQARSPLKRGKIGLILIIEQQLALYDFLLQTHTHIKSVSLPASLLLPYNK